MAETVNQPDSGAWPWIDLGRMGYAEALGLQHRFVDALSLQEASADPKPLNLAGGIFLFLEHPPVFTLGKRGGTEFLNVAEDWLANQGIPVVATERGGFITYHGPGQLIVYPVVRLKSLRVSVRDLVDGLEAVMIRVLAYWGIDAGRNEANRGVWVGERKIGSIGIHVRKGVCFHGMALNVNTDLRPFGWIQPCGLSGVAMTSLKELTGSGIPMAEVLQQTVVAIEKVFHIRMQRIASLSGVLGKQS
ncbi:lipoyl(octanoyl) transferase LipB [Desulfatirhabdium butyrativorans]|uniref:lipoyl(octanoyl) transferase LipB n=1 Tax=Desulfatirhabdium butyrativorans TaxID=340467 RepID=UPI0004065882|nr:lipoyl(octanoyl) transferase LipB [Desulfatirhabdium butyrativorans]